MGRACKNFTLHMLLFYKFQFYLSAQDSELLHCIHAQYSDKTRGLALLHAVCLPVSSMRANLKFLSYVQASEHKHDISFTVIARVGRSRGGAEIRLSGILCSHAAKCRYIRKRNRLKYPCQAGKGRSG